MKNKNCISQIVTFLLGPMLLFAQDQYEGPCCPYPPGGYETPTSYDIYDDLKRLSFLGSVLYIAAHPDDENTHLMSYFSNQIRAKTAYLSLTRGDGGQNRIGTELREQLGVIRTQELLSARAIDGGQQYFSRANDFGYSKNPTETLSIWDENQVLEDIVWVIRKTQPDIIINRFDHRTPGTTHGHHTASAILSKRAFSLAGNSSVFPQQFDYVSPYQPKRLFLNQSYWFYGSEEAFAKIDKSNFVELEVGIHYYGKGKSNNDIAAASRTQHRCQGMGTTPLQGQHLEYLEWIDGNALNTKNDIFSGINTSWTRIKGGDKIQFLVEKITSEYDFSLPYKSLPSLVSLYQAIEKLEDGFWKQVKLDELKKIIWDCSYIHIVALGKTASVTPGDSLQIQLEMVNQIPETIRLLGISFTGKTKDKTTIELPFNKVLKKDLQIHTPKDIPIDNPYWLNEKGTLGMYRVDQQELRGLPEGANQLYVDVLLEICDKSFSFHLPLSYRYTDAVVGQIYVAVKVTPTVFVKPEAPVYLFPNDQSRVINIIVEAGKDQVSGTLFPGQAENWTCIPDSVNFALASKGMSQRFEFELFPPKEQSEATLNPFIKVDSNYYDKSKYEIRYQHIPRQLVFLPASAKTVHIDLKIRGRKIAYLMGAGDVIPEELRHIGYDVDLLSIEQITTTQLQNYDALILGIRAYNVISDIAYRQKAIFDYANLGGTVIVQYNTNTSLQVEEPGPYPMQLSTDRVTDEDASVRIIKPDHILLNYPNTITEKDFDHWVQERGLYFPSEWDERYETILACNDPNESEKVSGLLYAKYGEGHFIYTGYSFFRQLPAGVPGAFRLFANMIAVGQKERP